MLLIRSQFGENTTIGDLSSTLDMFVFIDVWENPKQAKHFKIRAIPAQIFFDKDGKEVYRHLGFMSEKKSWPASENGSGFKPV